MFEYPFYQLCMSGLMVYHILLLRKEVCQIHSGVVDSGMHLTPD